MQETKRITKLLKDIYNGSPWIDVNVAGTLKGITAKQAAKRVFPKTNTIWEIVNHLISWRLNVLQRVQGKLMNAPADNYFSEVKDTSEAAWQNTLQQFEDSQKQWIDFLKDFNETDFEKVYTGNQMTYYEHIHGIIQHDAYHLGQVAMLAKQR